MDNDAEMLKQLGNQITNLQVKYRALPINEQVDVYPELKKLVEEYACYQAKLIEAGIITEDDDLKKIQELRESVDNAAKKTELLTAVGKLISFIAIRV